MNSAVVFCGTSNFAFAMASVIMDLKRLCPGIADEVVILHDGKLTQRDRQCLSTLWQTRFIPYEFPFAGNPLFKRNTLGYFTKMVFAKFECLRLLQDYATVLFLDYDIVVKQDISELMAPCPCAMRMLPGGGILASQLLRRYRTQSLDGYNLSVDGICASTFVFQHHLPDYMKLYDFCYAALEKYARHLYLPEQVIFSFMMQEFRLSFEPIDPLLYTPHPQNVSAAERAKIVHAYGQPKFWNGLQNEQWDRNYAAWLELGGTPYLPPPATLRDSISKFLRRDIKQMMIRWHGKR